MRESIAKSRPGFSVWWPVAALLVLILGAVTWGVNHEETDLTDRAQGALDAAAISLSVDFEGRDATLSGTVIDAGDIDRAEEIVWAVTGARTVTLSAVRVGSPAAEVIDLGGASLTLDFDGDNLTLSGRVPDEATANTLIDQASAHFGSGNVIGQLTVDSTTDSPTWLRGFGDVFANLGEWHSGTLNATDDGIVLGGVVQTVAASDALAEAIAAAAGLSIDNQLEPIILDPPFLVLEAEGSSITLSGQLSTEGDIDLIVSRVELLYDEVSTTLSVGQVYDATWIPLVPGFLDRVAGWPHWRVEISDANQTIEGVAPSTAALIGVRSSFLAQFGSNWDDSGLEVDPPALATEITAALAGTINFKTGSSALDDDSKLVLDGIAELLAANVSASLVVEGHSDSNGDPAVNLTLSASRAQSVVDYLLGSGIDSGRLSAQGYGDTRPIADNATAEGRSQNRRIEFVVAGLD